MFNLLQGKKGIVLGVVNNQSLAFAIAKNARENGAEVVISYQKESWQSRVEKVAAEANINRLVCCDLTVEDSLSAVVETIERDLGKIDFVVHSVAYASKAALGGRISEVSKEDFLYSMEVSCFSLIKLVHALQPILNPGSSILTLSYHGSRVVVPEYNMMGIAKAALEATVRYLAAEMGEGCVRVNCLSAGAIKTLAASAIPNFSLMLEKQERFCPLKRLITKEEIANSALYLLSDLSSGVTGEVHYVDCGSNIMFF